MSRPDRQIEVFATRGGFFAVAERTRGPFLKPWSAWRWTAEPVFILKADALDYLTGESNRRRAIMSRTSSNHIKSLAAPGCQSIVQEQQEYA